MLTFLWRGRLFAYTKEDKFKAIEMLDKEGVTYLIQSTNVLMFVTEVYPSQPLIYAQ